MPKKVALIYLMIAIFITETVGLNAFAYSGERQGTDNRLVIYVSASEGADSGDGSFLSPLKSLEAARSMAIKAKDSSEYSSVEIYLRGGTYERNRSFYIDKKDSETLNCPITYRAYNNEDVTITGSVRLDGSVMQKVYDRKLLSRLAESGVYDKLYVIDAKLLGIDLSKELMIGENRLSYRNYGSRNPVVMINGVTGSVARWPDNGYVGIKSVSNKGKMSDKESEAQGIGIELYQDRMKYWHTSPDAYMYGRYTTGWQDQSIRIKSIDCENRIVNGEDPSVSGISKDAASLFFYNIFEEISQNGEYYADTEADKIYFCADNVDDVRLITLREPIAELNGVSDVRFENITFDGSLGNGIVLTDCKNVKFKNCKIKNIGSRAFVLNGNCSKSGIEDSVVTDVFDGIYVGGGDYESLTSGENFVKNCSIENFGGQCYARGVSIGGIGNTVKNCTFYNSENMAIQLSGANNTVSYCEFSKILKHTGDMGVIYAADGWKMRGNKIINNYFHDIYSEKAFMLGTRMIYLDLSSSGTTIEGNVFENTDGYGVVIAEGCDNKINNNIFVNNSCPISIFQRQGVSDSTIAQYNAISKYIANENWLSAFPELSSITAQTYKAERTVVMNNIFVDTTHKNVILNDIEASEIGGFNSNYTTNTRNIFKDSNNKNFEISSEDVKNALPDYKNIDVSLCGSDLSDAEHTSQSGDDTDAGAALVCSFEKGAVTDGKKYGDSDFGDDFFSVTEANQSIELVDSLSHSGNKSLRVVSSIWKAPCFKFSVQPNKVYKFSAYVHNLMPNGNNSVYNVLSLDANAYSVDGVEEYAMSGYVTGHHSAVTRDGWTHIERLVYVPAADNEQKEIKLGVYTAATENVEYLIDDVSLSAATDTKIYSNFIAGQNTVYSSDEPEVCYTAALILGNSEMNRCSVSYCLKESVEGVSVGSSDGKLKVNPGIDATAVIKANVKSEVFGNYECEIPVRIIGGEEPKIDEIRVGGNLCREFAPGKRDYYNQKFSEDDGWTVSCGNYTAQTEAVSGMFYVIRISVCGNDSRSVYSFYKERPSNGENLISDGGFESGINSFVYPKTSVDVIGGNSHSGSYSARVTLGKYGGAYSKFRAESDRMYLAYMWVKLADDSKSQYAFFSADGANIITDDLSKSCGGGIFDDSNLNYRKAVKLYADKWVLLKRIFYVDSPSNVNVGLYNYNDTLRCYVDDVYISELKNGAEIKHHLDSGNSEFYETFIQNASDEYYTVVVASKTPDKSGNAELMYASYDGDSLDNLTAIDVVTGGVEVFTLPKKSNIKIFLWNNMVEMMPLTASIEKVQ